MKNKGLKIQKENVRSLKETKINAKKGTRLNTKKDVKGTIENKGNAKEKVGTLEETKLDTKKETRSNAKKDIKDTIENKEDAKENVEVNKKAKIEKEVKLEEQNSSEKMLGGIVSSIKEFTDEKEDVPEWWKMLTKKDRYQIGDVVLLNDSNKYAVFCGPAKKEGLVKLNIIKKRLSKGFYSRNWYVSLDDIELVRRKDRITSNFICTNDRIYKIFK